MRKFVNLSRIVLLLTGGTVFGAENASVQYTLSFPNAVHHEGQVRAVFSGVKGPLLEVKMSRSSPGRYALHEFAKNVYGVKASDGAGQALSITQPDPYGWNVAVPGGSGTVVFEYTLFGDRADGTYDGIDETHAHLNMPATLVWAHGFENAAADVRFDLPPGKKWKVATQLLPQSDGSWSAPDLEMLMDAPVEISNHTVEEWTVENARFRMALHHQGTQGEAEHYARMCQAVVLEEEGVFGALPKYDGGTYTFLLDYLPYVQGDGMEHRDSTYITDGGNLGERASEMIGTVSHEFFHSWNVRRIRPKSLEPFDFERADMSGELWFAEGFTNYYGPLVLQRAGLADMRAFTTSMGQAVNRVLTAPGRNVHSAVEMSDLAPFTDAATSLDPNNFKNTFISYYTYGSALALGIDLYIREHYPGKSLDDWMRVMWRQHPDIQKPYTLADLQSGLGDAVNDQAFAAEVFRRHIEGKEPLPYGELLLPGGMLLRRSHPGEAWWGKSDTKFGTTGLELTSQTLRDTPLYDAGLDKGDFILSVNGKAVESAEVLASRKVGEKLRLKVRTRGGDRETSLVVGENPELEIVTFEDAGRTVTPEVEAFRRAWLGSKALRKLPDID